MRARAEGRDGRELLLAFGGKASVVASTFALMKVAEDEIRERWPKPRSEPRDIFMLLLPPPGFSGLDPRAYRAHAKELISRVFAGERVEPPTRAEVMVALSVQSTRAPLPEYLSRCYEALFAEIFPEDVRRILGRDPRREWRPEVLGEVERQIADLVVEGRRRTGRTWPVRRDL